VARLRNVGAQDFNGVWERPGGGQQKWIRAVTPVNGGSGKKSGDSRTTRQLLCQWKEKKGKKERCWKGKTPCGDLTASTNPEGEGSARKKKKSKTTHPSKQKNPFHLAKRDVQRKSEGEKRADRKPAQKKQHRRNKGKRLGKKRKKRGADSATRFFENLRRLETKIRNGWSNTN